MQAAQHSSICNFIWGVADDVLRDIYVRGKYRDIILPMTIIRRLDLALEPTRGTVLAAKAELDALGVTDQETALKAQTGLSFYNASPYTLRELPTLAGGRQQLKANFAAYLDGFSSNVREILEKFDFRRQLDTLDAADQLGSLLDKFLSPDINLGPHPVKGADGSIRLPGLDNHAMGSIFEELVRRFNEENNEEAGEHWTPRDAVQLMAQLVFEPVAAELASAPYLLYDGALGTGGMLTIAEATLRRLGEERGQEVTTHLYGQEINAETYAICKADLLLKGANDGNVVGGPEHSTLSNDAFPNLKFDFMLSNPPYGKSWKSDYEKIGPGGRSDPRFVIQHGGDPAYSLLPRTSDGQLLFLVNLLNKMKNNTPQGSRLAEVHNGSSLFTGDAGQGESNIRRWIIESDWLEAIVALPLNMFYNTGIATYIWVLTNRKPPHRRGYVQLIDATQWHTPLRKNLGQKNCELSETDIRRIVDAFLEFRETEQSKIFPNAAFGYWRVTVERPLRLPGIDPERAYKSAEIRQLKAAAANGSAAPPADSDTAAAPNANGAHANAPDAAHPVIRKIHPKGAAPDPLAGRFPQTIQGQPRVVEYEPDPEQRDAEQIPLLHPGGIAGFLQTEVLPYAPDAWYGSGSVKTGYEISFTRHFHRPQPLRPLTEIQAEIAALEQPGGGAPE